MPGLQLPSRKVLLFSFMDRSYTNPSRTFHPTQDMPTPSTWWRLREALTQKETGSNQQTKCRLKSS